ncbi:MAG TPA: acyl-CoA dehydrogenase family protein, partial [Acidimicrobiales bacterium]|nr:acyl-CoA dehydrogenase family protein [Acidimicrobiales bacterium]
MTTSADLVAAAQAVETAQQLVDAACAAVRAHGGVDANQVVAYDVAHAAAAVATARATLEYGARGEVEARIAAAFVADVVADLAGRIAGRESRWGVEPGWVGPLSSFLEAQRDPAVLAGLAATEGPRHLGEDFELVRETFHRFAEEKVRPHAEQVHRHNADIPEEVIEGLAEIGGFGLSVPEEYGGFASGGESDYLGMVVATEELSWGSLGVGGSLITRPEILT